MAITPAAPAMIPRLPPNKANDIPTIMELHIPKSGLTSNNVPYAALAGRVVKATIEPDNISRKTDALEVFLTFALLSIHTIVFVFDCLS